MKRRLATKGWLAQTGGVALTAVGFAWFLIGLVTSLQTEGRMSVALMLGGGQSMIIGTILYCYQQLLIRSVKNEEALMFQYDIGYEQGYQDRERLARPVLVDLQARKSALKAAERV